MGVTISEYLVNNNNKLTALLNYEGLDGVFLDDTLINVDQRNGVWVCDFLLDYALTCDDLAKIADAFSEYWWCVSTFFATNGYRLLVNLKNDL